MKMTRLQIDTMLESLSMPTLLLMADNGLASTHARKFESLAQHVPGGLIESHPGGHHFHMEKGVATLADRIRRFLAGELD